MPEIPQFIFAPDHKANELYILHTHNPMALIWVRQTVPAQLFVVKHEPISGNTDKALAAVLRGAAKFYRDYSGKMNMN